MKVGLIDADMMWQPHANGRRYGNTKADIYPNLALMKLSAWFKAQDVEVEWYNPMNGHYDQVYVSKVFSTTPTSREYIDADFIVCGGTGWQIKLENGKEVFHENVHFDNSKQTVIFSRHLTEEAEHIMPDYSLYPGIHDTAYGFLTRGCPRGCEFCHVADKEGRKAYKVADLKEWWNGQKNIVLMDPNILACRSWKGLLRQLSDSRAKVDINQGLDARLMTEAKASALAKIRLSTIRFAWDRYKDKEKVLRGLNLFKDWYPRKLGHQAQVFVLTNYDSTFEEDLARVYTLKEMEFEPYIMVYDKPHAHKKYKSLQRWVNMRAIFHTVERFEDYDPIEAKE